MLLGAPSAAAARSAASRRRLHRRLLSRSLAPPAEARLVSPEAEDDDCSGHARTHAEPPHPRTP